MKSLLCVIVGVMLFGRVGYGAHDLACYAIIEPSEEWIQADSVIIPKLGIANLGNQAEVNFPVEFLVIDKEGLLGYDNDTVFADTIIVSYIGPYPDSIEVEFEEWTPDGLCDDWDPFRYYELLGVVSLYSDDDRSNDTVCHEATCLWSHDVGVINMEWPEPPDEPPDHYDPGSTITVTATVENFGYHAEHNIEVRLEVRDLDSNGVELWQALTSISFLDWRGNSAGNPYTIDVCFPTYDVLTDRHWQSLTCCTELERDACPKNDCEVRYSPPGIVEGAEAFPECFSLEIPGSTISAGCQIRFAVPHRSWVKLDVFDVNGRWVKPIANDIFEPGRYSCSWDRCDACGRKVAAGIYLIRMEADGFSDVRKVVVVN